MTSLGAKWQVGVARRNITPPPGVELAGLGYYLNRTWTNIRDSLNATALVVANAKGEGVAWVALDLMYNDAGFTRAVRTRVAACTPLLPDSVCVNCSHSHSAPTAGLILGAGERNEDYLRSAARAAADTVEAAWKSLQPAVLRVGSSELTGMTFNRTRENGLVDPTVSVLRADTVDGRPLAVAVNFHAHCIAHLETDLFAVTRDWPGEVVDQIEATLPGAIALYLQGTCGDVNFRRELNGTARRFEPAQALTRVALAAWQTSRPVEASGIAAVTRDLDLPTRRWTREEISRDREEGMYRIKTGDTTGWRDGIARVCVNQPERLPLRYGGSTERAAAAVARFAVEWTDRILPEWETRPELLPTEVQAIRIGDVYCCAYPAELFTSLGLEVRRQWNRRDLFMLGFSNGSIGYLPDAHDVALHSYAAIQSPKCTGQFPFTADSGTAMVDGLLATLGQVADAG